MQVQITMRSGARFSGEVVGDDGERLVIDDPETTWARTVTKHAIASIRLFP